MEAAGQTTPSVKGMTKRLTAFICHILRTTSLEHPFTTEELEGRQRGARQRERINRGQSLCMDQYRPGKLCNFSHQGPSSLERYGRQRPNYGHLFIILHLSVCVCVADCSIKSLFFYLSLSLYLCHSLKVKQICLFLDL